jgi:hypothetical protein
LAIRDQPFSIYYGAALAGAYLEESVIVEDPNTQPTRFDVDRSVTAVLASGGLATHVNRFLRIRTYLSASYAGLRDDTEVSTATARSEQLSQLPASVADWEADALSGYGSVEAIYDRWYGQQRVELTGLYNLGYTELDSATDERFDASGWTRTAVFRGRLSGPTRLSTEGRNWRWTAYLNHTRFPGQDKGALGFRYYSEIGVGMSWDWNIKPLDMFGLRAIGFGGGLIIGDDVRGATLGFSFK